MLENKITHVYSTRWIVSDVKSCLPDTDNKTCDKCVDYIGEQVVCSLCDDIYTRTNRKTHMQSFKCSSQHKYLYIYRIN